MFFYKPPYILYRDYPDFGYLTDNRNFGYDTAAKSCVKVGDRVLSKTGSVFYSVLKDYPQSLDVISGQLLPLFVGVSAHELKADAKEFFLGLAKDGFVGCGKIVVQHSSFFSYSDKSPKTLQENVSEKEDEEEFFEKWGSQYHLSRVHLEVSGRCNEHCAHCYFPDSYDKGIMSKDVFLKILKQAKECHVLSITISGGEPMLNPNLPFFISECRKTNYSINLLSNLSLLTDTLLQEFIKTPLLSVQTSLYSMTPGVHDSITRVKGSFEKTKRAIELLYQHNIPMQINCPIMKQNRDTYQDVLNWSKALNIEASSDYMLFGCFDGSGNNLKSRLELSELDYIIKEESKRGSDNMKEFNLSKRAGDYAICPVCVSSLCISHNGDVYPCEGWQGYLLGNIHNETLKHIWEESVRVLELRNLSYADFPKCGSCINKEFCSICLLRNMNESRSGNFREVNPYFCEIARKKKEYSANN